MHPGVALYRVVRARDDRRRTGMQKNFTRGWRERNGQIRGGKADEATRKRSREIGDQRTKTDERRGTGTRKVFVAIDAKRVRVVAAALFFSPLDVGVGRHCRGDAGSPYNVDIYFVCQVCTWYIRLHERVIGSTLRRGRDDDSFRRRHDILLRSFRVVDPRLARWILLVTVRERSLLKTGEYLPRVDDQFCSR